MFKNLTNDIATIVASGKLKQISATLRHVVIVPSK